MVLSISIFCIGGCGESGDYGNIDISKFVICGYGVIVIAVIFCLIQSVNVLLVLVLSMNKIVGYWQNWRFENFKIGSFGCLICAI